VLAAEKIAPLRDLAAVYKITVEVYKKAKERVGTGAHRWNPDTRETADHSIPYVVAATLIDGTVTPRSFNDAHLWDPALRALMQKIEVIENEEFTRAYVRLPVEHHTRVTVALANGEKLVGSAGGARDELSAPKSDREIAEKFRVLCEEPLGVRQCDALLAQLWKLDEMDDVAAIPPAFVIA
jgi:2-methylcitrate dehydratase